jgi:hypothetical protein
MKKPMNRTRTWAVAATYTTAIVMLITAVAFGGTSLREMVALGHQAHTHAPPPLSVPVGLTSSDMPTEAGSTMPGGGIITHFRGGRRANRIDGGGGRMIYTGTAAFEPTLGIDKKGNIFYQGKDPSGLGFSPMVVVSRDDGRSWDEVTPTLHTHTIDPFLYLDEETGRAFSADLTLPCTTISHSDDVGQSWTTSEACMLADHQNVFAGPPVSSPTVGYPNVVYLCAIDLAASLAPAETSCLKSLDGGLVWVRTGMPAYTIDPARGKFCDGATGHGFVDAEGTVYLPRGWCGQPYLAISRDEGANWERIQVADTGMAGPIQGVCAAVCTETFDHEAAVAVDDEGNIYYFWMGRNRLPYLAVSRDEGKSFTKPIMVGPPGLKEAWGPTLDIGATGKIALAYLGSTNAPGGESPIGRGPAYTEEVTWNGYITTTVNALSKKPRFFTTSLNPFSDPIGRGECSPVRCGAQGDFIEVVIDPDGRPWTSMVDACPAPGKVCGSTGGPGFVGTVDGGPKLR